LSKACNTATCPLYDEQRCIIQTEHSTEGVTATCHPLYDEQRCIIQTEHSTEGVTATFHPLYDEQRCIIQTPPLQDVHCSAFYIQPDIQHFHTAAPAYITLSYGDITELETFQNCLAGSAQWVSRMCLFRSAKVNTTVPTAFIPATFWFPWNLHDDKLPHTDYFI
jgi:hypothetical protein